MHDLTRLMYEDGASRPAIPSTPANCFRWNGRMWRWTEITADQAPPQPMIVRGLYLYATEAYLDSAFHVNKYREDPERYMVDRHWRPTQDPGCNEDLYPARYGNPVLLTFIKFEELT